MYLMNDVPTISKSETNGNPTDLYINDPERDTEYQAYKEQVWIRLITLLL